jgi:uncharacterized protein (TIGR03435 family)
MRTVLGIACFALLSASVFAQSAGAPPATAPAAATNPTFVIADVHASPHRSFSRMIGPMLRGDRYLLRQAPMRDLVGIAYNINPGYVKGGPSWIEEDRFDVNAKMPPGTTADTARLMMRALLEDRFKLVARATTALAPGGLLTVGADKVKMKQSNGSGDSGCKFQFPPPNQQPGAVSYMVLSCHNISMEAFAPTLHNYIYEYMPGPISDGTGLKGTWDFDLKWSNRGQLATAGADGITIFDAVEKQLGLKLLGNQMAQRPVVMVDSVNETPTPNSPDLAKILPPLPPPEIEVATIKPSQTGKLGGFRFNGSELNVQGLTLKNLIYFAWDLSWSDDEVLAGAPKWLDSDRFDIVAKVATEENGNAQAPPFIDIEDLRRMLRELLVDRFEIKTHSEDQPITAFTMTAANLKLTKADPTSRTRCAEAPGPDGKDPRIANPVLDRLVSCQNMTMAQIAQEFQELAPGYIYSDVRDATGIAGTWDFTLSFSSAWLTKGGGGMIPAADPAPASDPNGAISFFDAVNKQLGLKLEKQKRSLPVLVIDHIDEQPTEN